MAGRGRPRKFVVICKPKRPRGRPRKHPQSEPIPFHPERAYRCKYYSQCLQAAAFNKHGQLDCSGCMKREDKPLDLSPVQVFRHYVFLAAVLKPDAFREYWELRRGADWGLTRVG